VRQAITARGIDYPVAIDNDFEVWSAFDNHYWPALYFVDANGNIRDHHFGEGRYQLVRQHNAVRDRTLEIAFLEPGAEAYLFTFG
jgi:hypothetical protein